MRKLLNPFLFIWVLNVICALILKDGGFYSYIIELVTLSFHWSDTLWFMKIIFFVYAICFFVYNLIPENKRIVFIFLVDFRFFFGNRLFVAKIFNFKTVDFGLHFNHFNRVFLHPNRLQDNGLYHPLLYPNLNALI